jgi:pyruvate kinase
MGETRQSTRRVKIVATLGPASANPTRACELCEAGADVFRLNAAHLKPEGILPLVELVRGVEETCGRPIGVFLDLAGPKLRVAATLSPIVLSDGAVVTIGNQDSSAMLRVEGMDPLRECPPGSHVLVHDGKVALRVTGPGEQLVHAEILRGGEISGGMGVNLPDVETSLPSLTAQDIRCLKAALAAGVDACSLSFVRRAQDVTELRARMADLGRVVPIIAKLEKAQAVTSDALREILSAADTVMVARGDLGAETAPEKVPVLQKEILRAARAMGVSVITATEMLESMIHEPRPTRAEAADVANAVYDGSDAVMLSAETAIGDHPGLAVAACSHIIDEAERYPEFRAVWAAAPCQPEVRDRVADAVAEAAAAAGDHLRAAAIVCFTQTGRTARLVARYRPLTPILALAPRVEVVRALTLVWGVQPRVSAEQPADHEEVVRLAQRATVRERLAKPGDVIVVTHGAPLVAQPLTNLMRVHRVTD